jgi:phospholipid/cholesterol/gamma-HCH transport system substrate-binding protein
MPRTRSLGWSELKIGVLTITALVIAAVLIFSLTGSKGFFWQRYSLKTRFPNVAGLNPGSPVRVAGVEVGSVTVIDFAGEQVDVTFELKKAVQNRITDRSVARLGSVSLLGESAIDITPATGGKPLAEWDYVPQGKAAAALSDVTEQAGEGITELTALIKDVRSGRGTVGKLMTDEALYTDLHRFVQTAGDLTEGIKQGRGSIGKLLNDPQTANTLNAALQNIETMTRELNAGQGSLGKLLKDDQFAKSLNGATGNLETLVARLNRGEGTAGKLFNDPALYNRLNSVSERLDTVIAKLNEGEGTAGRLLKDERLYENMNGAVADFRRLLSQISNDPKKYLNVKVSIF